MIETAISTKSIQTYIEGKAVVKSDHIAVEEPLEIQLCEHNGIPEKVSITMRTPGDDVDLALGFLFTEGIVTQSSDIANIAHTKDILGNNTHTIVVRLNPNVSFDKSKISRNFYTTSSCGVCGKASIDAIQIIRPFEQENRIQNINSQMICELPDKLRLAQETFNKTGGLHASALFDIEGNLILLREDVGRHNALDKVIGNMFIQNKLPLRECILLLSGRVSFELIQKAAMAGIQIVAAVGAPSSLAIETAENFGITLIGFVKSNKLNVYCHPNILSN